ncbi:MAG: hypothetical protein K6E13_02635, partial [Lachnospiraceae bacterium]|nr:hypothetical protein [Lachnospiraceae bacterium]
FSLIVGFIPATYVYASATYKVPTVVVMTLTSDDSLTDVETLDTSLSGTMYTDKSDVPAAALYIDDLFPTHRGMDVASGYDRIKILLKKNVSNYIIMMLYD